MSAITTCPSCGKRNRVPVVATGKPRCAACHHDLPWLVDAGSHDFDAAVRASVPVVVDLWAPWCGPCRTMALTLEQLSRQRAGGLKVVKVNVDEHPEVSARHQVEGIPTLLLFSDGRLVDRRVGAAPAATLECWLDTVA